LAVRSGELQGGLFDVDVQGAFQGEELMFKVSLFDEQGEVTGVR
jgi:hypothetical protein